MKKEFTFSAIPDSVNPEDIEVRLNGRSLRLLGSSGISREIETVARSLEKSGLPVLLGAGMGAGLRHALKSTSGSVAVVDIEPEARKLANLPQGLSEEEQKRILWITEENPAEALKILTKWQDENGSLAFTPVPFFFYQRLRPDYYGEIRKSLDASANFNFWQKAHAPRFVSAKPRVLLLASKYFLIGELQRACKKLEMPYKLVMVGEGGTDAQEFVKNLLESVITFKPDCAITLNHMGVDREGILMDMLGKLQLPLASWFVDNPHLIVHSYHKAVSPWSMLFSWDEDNIASLKAAGFEHVRYLPLGTDPDRFRPGLKGKAQWRSKVSFVGNSMVHKVAGRLKNGHFSKTLLLAYKEIAAAFAKSEEREVAQFIRKNFPRIHGAYLDLQDNEDRLAYETAITWQATRLYRNACVERLLPFKPLIIGDDGWNTEFRAWGQSARLLPPISYYDELPAFYGQSDINFNCTSKQMKGAVNQRIFDVPATGSFVLTDWRPQMRNLFDDKEMVCFHDRDEIPDLAAYYLKHPKEREKFAARARKRVLAQHKWEDRLAQMLSEMAHVYGTTSP